MNTHVFQGQTGNANRLGAPVNCHFWHFIFSSRRQL